MNKPYKPWLHTSDALIRFTHASIDVELNKLTTRGQSLWRSCPEDPYRKCDGTTMVVKNGMMSGNFGGKRCPAVATLRLDYMCDCGSTHTAYFCKICAVTYKLRGG